MNIKHTLSLAAISLSLLLTACGSNAQKEAKSIEVPPPKAKPAALPASVANQATPIFQKIDTVVGTGATAEAGQTVSVHYTGWLYDAAAENQRGTKFDSSVDRGQPFEFPLGAGRVIKGWDQGFAGMQVGGKRTLVIPAEMGYGARGAGSKIPPNATLVFDVEMLGVK